MSRITFLTFFRPDINRSINSLRCSLLACSAAKATIHSENLAKPVKLSLKLLRVQTIRLFVLSWSIFSMPIDQISRSFIPWSESEEMLYAVRESTRIRTILLPCQNEGIETTSVLNVKVEDAHAAEPSSKRLKTEDTTPRLAPPLNIPEWPSKT